MIRPLLLLVALAPLVAAQGFVDQTFRAGLGGIQNTNGVAVADYDNDGDLDLYVVARPAFDASDLRTYSRLYRNDGSGVFTDVTLDAGITVDTRPGYEDTRNFGVQYVAAWGDYDGDGFHDLFLGHYGPDQLFRNRGDGTFEDVTASAGVAGTNPGQVSVSATWFDLDNDRDLDLYVGHWWDYTPLPDRDLRNRLYENLGDGTFRDISAASGADDDGATWAALPFDADHDGFIDLYLTTDTDTLTGVGVNRLYLNNGDRTFREETAAYNMESDDYGMGVAIGDADGNGLLDVYVTNVADPTRFQSNPLFLQTSPGVYEDGAVAAGVDLAGWGWGTEFVDVESDGDQDLLVVTGLFSEDYSNYLFRNAGPGGPLAFTEEAEAFGIAERLSARGMAAFDGDGDGDQDLIVSNVFQPPFYYENRTPQGAWLQVELESAVSNRHGLGAVVEAWVDGRPHVRLHHGAQYLAQNQTPVHLGLGAATVADSLVVRWPSGRVDRVEGVAVNRRVKVVEGEGLGVPTSTPSGPDASTLRLIAGPNPSRGPVAVRVEGANGPVRLVVFDVLGRRVGGAEGDRWTGALAAGVYVVRAEADGATASTRISVVR